MLVRQPVEPRQFITEDHAVDRPTETPADGDLLPTPDDWRSVRAMLTRAGADGMTNAGEEGVVFLLDMVDDKSRLLAEMKSVLGDRLTTVFVRQGHYAREAIGQSIVPPPDLTVERINELASFDLQRFGLPRTAQFESRPAPNPRGQP